MTSVLKNISVVMPCYNEQQAIPTIVPRLLKSLEGLKNRDMIEDFELIVVNDKSTDNSARLLSKYKEVKVVETPGTHRGYGLALKKGFSEAKGQWIAFLDVDNSYRPEDLENLVNAVEPSGSDFIMGSRGFSEEGMSFTRGAGNWLYMFLAKVLYGSQLEDVCTGFRLFHRRHLSDVLQIPEDGLDFSIFLTLKMLVNKVRIEQIPIQYDVRLGDSKLSVVQDGIAFLRVLLTLKVRQSRGLKHSQV
ncbi:MAG: glycosyltransferase family 2 protein [Bdellovibrionales bacterium]|nr:glycosyltransferase family 2 protein [Bdellovibrionales bacterium]NQZ18548.1 glycosyltransferase family 2 protein [Bdellovibrionales bacterium]